MNYYYPISFGAAITMFSGTSIPETFSKLLFNPFCFLLYENDQTPPNEWNVCYVIYTTVVTVHQLLTACWLFQVSMSFIGNTALLGSIGYLRSVKSCSWKQLKEPYFDTSDVLRWEFIEQQ